MAIDIEKNNNEYVITDESNQIRVASFMNNNFNDDSIMDILYRETELLHIENKICELEKKLSDSLSNSRLFKAIKSEMNLLIRKYELLEHDLYLIKEELGFTEHTLRK